MKTIKHITLFALVSSLFACVPARKFEELKAKYDACETDRAALKNSKQTNQTAINELNTKIEEANKDIATLKADTTQVHKEYNRLKKVNDDLNNTYDLLLQRNRELLAGNVDETNKLMKSLQESKEDLQKREDELKRLEAEFAKKQTDYEAAQGSLQQAQSNLSKSQSELNDKAKRVAELEALINRKDSISKALKTQVSKALLGFENNGLTVEQRNGKVYVSLEEQLLFASGSKEIGVKGKEALVKLAKILEEQKDVNISIEGHTDDVPYKGSGSIKDNWDLSVLRATTVVRILTENSTIDPVRLTPSGKGPFLPLDTEKTKEARSKNRRTEIVLTPKLDELLELLGN